MTKRMLIDATHTEETRVVVLDSSRLEDFDVETSTKRQLKGNIYLAKVVRVEPSLQAAFVEYGGNRHGFLAFGEIHPDYYQIPVADRQRLIEQQAEDARREEEEEDRAAEAAAGEAAAQTEPSDAAAGEEAEPELIEPEPIAPEPIAPEPIAPVVVAETPDEYTAAQPAQIVGEVVTVPFGGSEPSSEPDEPISAEHEAESIEATLDVIEAEAEPPAEVVADAGDAIAVAGESGEEPPPETVGGESDSADDARERRIPPRYLRNYKIQEVIKRRQILLVQVVKEERGTKGAALTTYLSLAGRFCVLMPNSPRGGGISRKITSPTDRRRLKDIMAELDIARGMGLIVRTAGANRPKAEIKRDCEYLLRLWDDIREHTLKSVAPALIYEEASLIKRAIRDVYSRDIDEIQVDGEEGWRAAHEFMRMLMPSHAKKVQLWKNGGMPLFAKYQVEAQLDSMLLPTVQLRSGGYLVINQTEALVAIDVNSGRSTRERGIEETALRTNLEAADEVARQLRLRDLAGLIVIDFIDMETRKHNAMVEKRLKEALKNDRARIQVGQISHFGLMEMSRQRLRPSLAETSFITCPHCGGMGHVRSTESAAIHVLRGIEEEGSKRRAAEIVVYAAPLVALYILNHKRERLTDIELRYGMRVVCLGDDGQMISQFRIERLKAQVVIEAPVTVTQAEALPPPEADVEEESVAVDEEAEDEVSEDAVRAVAGETAEEAEHRHRRRRRRRRGGRREEAPAVLATDEVPVGDGDGNGDGAEVSETSVEGVPEHVEVGQDEQHAEQGQAAGGRLRRGRRGGRRRRNDANGEMPPHAEPGAEQPELPPVYSGPTPADPFGGHTFDIFDVLEQAEDVTPHVAAANAVVEPAVTNVSVTTEPEPARAAAAEVAAPEPEPAPAIVLAEPEPKQAEAAAPEPAPAIVLAEPEPTQAAPEPLPPEPEPVVAANDIAPEPAIKPIIIGGEQDVVLEKKRGWWRR
jgi:ribonuclease E